MLPNGPDRSWRKPGHFLKPNLRRNHNLEFVHGSQQISPETVTRLVWRTKARQTTHAARMTWLRRGKLPQISIFCKSGIRVEHDMRWCETSIFCIFRGFVFWVLFKHQASCEAESLTTTRSWILIELPHTLFYACWPLKLPKTIQIFKKRRKLAKLLSKTFRAALKFVIFVFFAFFERHATMARVINGWNFDTA